MAAAKKIKTAGDAIRPATILDQASGASWTLAHGDCIEALRDLEDKSVDFSVYSPPYSSLYVYGASERDMGNVDDDAQFFDFYRLMIREKLRVTRPGRLTAIHVKDLVYYQTSSERGDSGLRPFSDMCVAEHVAAGWSYHCRITIWRDPVLERSKTNAHGLLRKTRRADSTFCRVGMPEYLLVFRKWAKPGEEHHVRAVENPDYPTELWQQEASPVWDGETIWNYQLGQSGRGDFDLKATDVLNVRAARNEDQERHIAPMPLNISERAIHMWSSRGDVVLSPFAGIGSEGWSALRIGRKFVGVELNETYYRQALQNLRAAEETFSGGDLLSRLDANAVEPSGATARPAGTERAASL
jgi:DNA modification methylase